MSFDFVALSNKGPGCPEYPLPRNILRQIDKLSKDIRNRIIFTPSFSDSPITIHKSICPVLVLYFGRQSLRLELWVSPELSMYTRRVRGISNIMT